MRRRCSTRSSTVSDAAEHHRGGRGYAEVVALTHDVEPLVRGRLLGRDVAAHGVHEDLGAAAGQRVQTGVAQAREHLARGEPGELAQVHDLGRAEAVHVDGVAGLELAQHALVPLERQVGVHAALQKDRRALEIERLLDLRVELVGREHVGVGVVRVAVERAEPATAHAHVGVVHVAVHDERDLALGVQPVAHRARGHAEVQQFRVAQQRQASSSVRRPSPRTTRSTRSATMPRAWAASGVMRLMP